MTADPSDAPNASRSGFVTFVGRPNVGKSTLMNALVGEKIAITSEKPQTTRRAIRGIVNRPGGQLVIVDTPGIHKPRTLLGQRLNDLVDDVLGDVDVIGFCVPATDPVGPGDRRIAASLTGYPRAKKIAIVTKIDAATREQVTERLMEVDALREDWAAVIPLSAWPDAGSTSSATRCSPSCRRDRRSTPMTWSPTNPWTIASRRSSGRPHWKESGTNCRTRSRWSSRTSRTARTAT